MFTIFSRIVQRVLLNTLALQVRGIVMNDFLFLWYLAYILDNAPLLKGWLPSILMVLETSNLYITGSDEFRNRHRNEVTDYDSFSFLGEVVHSCQDIFAFLGCGFLEGSNYINNPSWKWPRMCGGVQGSGGNLMNFPLYLHTWHLFANPRSLESW